MALHPNAIAENGAACKRTRRIDSDDADAVFLRAIVLC